MASGGETGTTHTMYRNIPIPRALSLTGNLAQNWKVFQRDWKNYEITSKLSTEDMSVRVATLLSCIGSDAMNVFDGFNMSDRERENVVIIMKAFESYCIGETNETYERFVFNGRNQRQQESVEMYIAELRKLSRSCNFEEIEESLIRDRLVMGLLCDINQASDW